MTGLSTSLPVSSPGEPPWPEPEVVRAAQAEFLSDVAAFAPPLLEPAGHLLTGISTRNWALEWGLSSWIAHAYGLTLAQEHDLLVSDVFLLAVARAVDDLVDGESRAPTPDAVVLATALHHLWTRRYLLTFSAPQLRRFLPLLDVHTASWLLATLPGDSAAESGSKGAAPGLDDRRSGAGVADVARQADRGALLRISCVAGCLLAGREDATDALVAALDDVLVGVVLLDDVFDWRDDLDAGRRNAFVEACLASTTNALPPRLRVLHALHAGDTLEQYFATASRHLRAAASTSAGAACPGLAAYAQWYEAELGACGRWLRQRADHDVVRAAASLAPARPGTISPQGGGDVGTSVSTGS
jgi:hypothetical protein